MDDRVVLMELSWRRRRHATKPIENALAWPRVALRYLGSLVPSGFQVCIEHYRQRGLICQADGRTSAIQPVAVCGADVADVCQRGGWRTRGRRLPTRGESVWGRRVADVCRGQMSGRLASDEWGCMGQTSGRLDLAKKLCRDFILLCVEFAQILLRTLIKDRGELFAHASNLAAGLVGRCFVSSLCICTVRGHDHGSALR